MYSHCFRTDPYVFCSEHYLFLICIYILNKKSPFYIEQLVEGMFNWFTKGVSPTNVEVFPAWPDGSTGTDGHIQYRVWRNGAAAVAVGLVQAAAALTRLVELSSPEVGQ